MTGTFGTRMKKKGDAYEFVLNTNVLAPTTFVSSAGQVWQEYVSFSGWDTDAAAAAKKSEIVMSSFASEGSATAGWTPKEYFTDVFSTTNALNGKTKGGYTSVTVTGAKLTADAWDDYPVCTLGLQTSNRLLANCEVSRWFDYPSSYTLTVGLPVTFTAGFYVWPNTTVGDKVLPLASGVSTTLTYTIIEGAASLATMAVAAAALVTLSF